MIWTWIINGIFSILYYIISLLPAVDSAINSNISQYLTDFKSTLYSVSYFFPAYQFLSIISMILAIEASVFTYKLILWISSHLTAGFIKN